MLETLEHPSAPYVPGYGASTAKLAVVGEAPGRDEEAARRPFVGQSGQMLRDMIKKAGMSPESVYYTNVVKNRPPGNDITALDVLGRKIEDYLPHLWEELNVLKPNCILAIGNTALKALTGYDGIHGLDYSYRKLTTRRSDRYVELERFVLHPMGH